MHKIHMPEIAALDLEAIKIKLMHKESGEGWSLERACKVELEYRRFLYLMKHFPKAQTAPLAEVDTFWHYHILDTMKYAADCQAVFGYFLHHYPYIGMRDDEELRQDAGQRMAQLYEATFGESYLLAGQRMAFCGAADDSVPVPPVRLAFCGAADDSIPVPPSTIRQDAAHA